MLTELFQAIKNKKNYLFLVCRGKSEDINDWFFRLFNVQNFLKCFTQLVALKGENKKWELNEM